MKRIVSTVVVLAWVALLSGCSSDQHDGLVLTTINMINGAETNIRLVKERVQEAVNKTQKDGRKLDLTDAIEQTKQLKTVGEQAQKLKREIEQVRSKITEDERKSAATKYKDQINTAFDALTKQKDELRAVLTQAEGINSQAKTAVRELREKISEAEAPFEALAR